MLFAIGLAAIVLLTLLGWNVRPSPQSAAPWSEGRSFLPEYDVADVERMEVFSDDEPLSFSASLSLVSDIGEDD